MRGFRNFRFGKDVEVSAETVPAGNAGQEKHFSFGRLAKLLVMALVLAAVFASPIFAEGIDKLDQLGTKVIGLLNAKWLKAILALGLVIEFGVIAFGNAQGEGGMMKKVLPWVIGTAGILAATSIVGFFFSNIDPTTGIGMFTPDCIREAVGFLGDGIRRTGEVLSAGQV